MANEIEKFNAIALGDIEKINGFDDDDIQEINGFEFTYVPPVSYKGIFGFGRASGNLSITNLVSTSGVVASDTSGVGSARREPAACEWGPGSAIFGYGGPFPGAGSGTTNLVNTSGVVASNVSGVGSSRVQLAACGYGTDKGAFAYGNIPVDYEGWIDVQVSIKNLVNNSGVVQGDVTGVGTARQFLAATQYSTDKGIFGFGGSGSSPYYMGMTNLLSNSGVIGSDVSAVGNGRPYLSAASYGTSHSKGIFLTGSAGGDPNDGWVTNLVSDSGVVASNTAQTGTARNFGAACEYGEDKGISAFGNITGEAYVSLSQLISNAGVVSADVTGVGTGRSRLAACTFGT